MDMDVNAAAAANWERVFTSLLQKTNEVFLDDSDAHLYDFANAPLMRRMRERLVETLQSVSRTSPERLHSWNFGNKFFMTMNEQKQQDFFHDIFSLPVLQRGVDDLFVSNFALTRQTDVEALSNIILEKCETLRWLELESIECSVDDCNKQDSDGSDGFLDPLFHAASGLDSFCVSTKRRSVHSTLVSPTALRALFVEGGVSNQLRLRGLDLNDSHVLAIVDGLSTPGMHLNCLNLESNPGITAQGCGALLNLINRANVVGNGNFEDLHGFVVDDKAWEDKLDLVAEMNLKYGRLEYLTNGTFASEERKCQWLEELADRLRHEEFSDRGRRDYERRKKERDAKHVNFIWYTLCQNPEMMQT